MIDLEDKITKAANFLEELTDRWVYESKSENFGDYIKVARNFCDIHSLEFTRLYNTSQYENSEEILEMGFTYGRSDVFLKAYQDKVEVNYVNQALH